jgi:hypothetical protein
MTHDERIAANAAKGYILVKSFDGWEIYKKQNEVGGWTYYSDRIGYEGHYPIWDDCTRDVEELEAILEDLKQPAVPVPEPTKTLLELNGMVTKMRDYINKKLEE